MYGGSSNTRCVYLLTAKTAVRRLKQDTILEFNQEQIMGQNDLRKVGQPSAW